MRCCARFLLRRSNANAARIWESCQGICFPAIAPRFCFIQKMQCTSIVGDCSGDEDDVEEYPKMYGSLLSMEGVDKAQKEADYANAITLADKIVLLRIKDADHVMPIIHEWVAQGNKLNKLILLFLINNLRQRLRPFHALKIADWMVITQRFELNEKDAVERIDLSVRAGLIKKAEKLFEILPAEQKKEDAYYAMLLLYKRQRMVMKAQHILRKLREQNLLKEAYPFNLMATIYRRRKLDHRVLDLRDTMKELGIPMDTCFMNNLLAVKSKLEGIESAERLFKQLVLQNVSQKKKDLSTYITMANSYVSNREPQKVENLLLEIEKGLEREEFFKLQKISNVLISIYASTMNIPAMLRVWEKIEKPTSQNYICMIEALGRAEDVEKAEDFFKEADGKGLTGHSRMFNALLFTYAQAGIPEKSEMLVIRMRELELPQDAMCYHNLVRAYVRKNDLDKAIETLEKAQVAAKIGNLRPYYATLGLILVCLGERGDVERAEAVVFNWQKAKLHITINLYNQLLAVYVKAKKPAVGFLGRIAKGSQLPNLETLRLMEQLKSETSG